MKVDIKKLEEFKEKMQEFNDIAIDPKHPITQAEREAGVEIARQYYQYLKENGEIYGKIGIQVVTDSGLSGKIPNIIFRTQAVFEGVRKECLPELEDRAKICLSYADMKQRSKNGGELSCKLIVDYHKETFKALDLDPYVWAGLPVVETLGTDALLMLHGLDKQGFENIIAHISKAPSSTSGYSTARMASAMTHALACYALGEKPYSPIVYGFSQEDIAKQYDVDITQAVWITDQLEVIVQGEPFDDSYGPRIKIYKILPSGSQQDIAGLVEEAKLQVAAQEAELTKSQELQKAAEAQAAQATANGGSYKVQAGDTLSGLAQKYGMSLDQLLAIPGNEKFKANPDDIKLGQEVKVPSKDKDTTQQQQEAHKAIEVSKPTVEMTLPSVEPSQVSQQAVVPERKIGAEGETIKVDIAPPDNTIAAKQAEEAKSDYLTILNNAYDNIETLTPAQIVAFLCCNLKFPVLLYNYKLVAAS